MITDDSELMKRSIQSTQDALWQHKEFAENLIGDVHAVVLLDAQGRIIRFNRYMEETFGYEAGEMQGKDWFATFIPKCDQTRARAIFARTIEGAHIHSNIGTIVTRDGQDRYIRWFDVAVRDDHHKVTHLLKMGYDVTDVRQARQ